MSTPARLLEDLDAVGIHVPDIWVLVNRTESHDAAVPVILDWLRELDHRVLAGDRSRLREELVRALTIPAARPMAALELIRQFHGLAAAEDPSLRWAIGNALAVVADDSVVDDTIELVENPEFGRAR